MFFPFSYAKIFGIFLIYVLKILLTISYKVADWKIEIAQKNIASTKNPKRMAAFETRIQYLFIKLIRCPSRLIHTGFFLNILLTSSSKGNHSSEKRSEDSPAKDRNGINPDHATDKGTLAAP